MYQLTPPQNIKKYKFESELGKGTFGIVCKYIKDNVPYAIKMEYPWRYSNSISKEKKILKQLQENISKNKPKFPKYIEDGQFQLTLEQKYSVQYIVIEYLEQTLQNYYVDLINSDNAILGKAKMTEDIKPENFMVKDGDIYLIDFGSSIEFDLNKFQLDKEWEPTGTPLTMSIFALQKYYSCQGDDLISTLYTILYLQDPDCLPWISYCNNLNNDKPQNQSETNNKIREFKENLNENSQKLDESSKEIIKQIKSLERLRETQPDKFSTHIDYKSINEAIQQSYKNELRAVEQMTSSDKALSEQTYNDQRQDNAEQNQIEEFDKQNINDDLESQSQKHNLDQSQSYNDKDQNVNIKIDDIQLITNQSQDQDQVYNQHEQKIEQTQYKIENQDTQFQSFKNSNPPNYGSIVQLNREKLNADKLLHENVETIQPNRGNEFEKGHQKKERRGKDQNKNYKRYDQDIDNHRCCCQIC
ncbi:protein kinase domain containing protein [Stylonychia lemnae]|uniref:Protein kinase domain containing protein n=1 Tax=Stylonychia lemnae TaxID=5949 RepID=A0A078AMQ8_STYLE|nr:protein kinase domain containing protein [Stylonychia lemnae]|eukprot:CDW83439.1 protein kinase domain containing protein [Stylonychia lemnae]